MTSIRRERRRRQTCRSQFLMWRSVLMEPSDGPRSPAARKAAIAAISGLRLFGAPASPIPTKRLTRNANERLVVFTDLVRDRRRT